MVVIPVVDPAAYSARYAEGDKVATGLGEGVDAWSVPYWWVDGGMAVHGLLLAAVDAGLGALFFGLFAHERAVLAALGVPAGTAPWARWRWAGRRRRARTVGGAPATPLGSVVHRGRGDRRRPSFCQT